MVKYVFQDSIDYDSFTSYSHLILIQSRIISQDKLKCFYFLVNLESYQTHAKSRSLNHIRSYQTHAKSRSLNRTRFSPIDWLSGGVKR
jgi:hypothetical protein